MVRRSETIQLTAAIDGFLLHKAAEGRSRHTLADYRNCLRKLAEHCGDVPLRAIKLADLRQFFSHLHNGYTTTPGGCAPRPQQALAPKTIRNIHAACSSFYNWAIAEGLATTNPMERIQRPKANQPPIEPLSQRDILQLLEACQHSAPWHDRPAIRHSRPTAVRDTAILLLLLDTGMRASELCRLTIGDYDHSTGHCTILQGKGKKPRIVRAERSTRRAIWRYLNTREPDLPLAAPLFCAEDPHGPRPLSRWALTRLLKRMGERANIDNVYPHRFRHTFAIEYLRNNGDIYTLQSILGHSSLDMVRRYLHIAQVDIDQKHQTASPVKNWRL